MASRKQQWKDSVEKARRLSVESPARKGSVIGEETSTKELEEYLETLKKKSGIKSLWKGDSFDKFVRDDEDKTPDISISSVGDDEYGEFKSYPGLFLVLSLLGRVSFPFIPPASGIIMRLAYGHLSFISFCKIVTIVLVKSKNNHHCNYHCYHVVGHASSFSVATY